MKKYLLLWIFCFTSFCQASTNEWKGVPLPQFNLKNQSGETKTNSDFLKHWLVVYFYPKDKTPGCTVEAQKFVDDYPIYQKLNVEIIGVSYDDVESHKEFADLYNMPFSLLADTDKKFSKAMKVDKLLPWPHASRQTFIVNPEGIIVEHISEVSPETHSKQLLESLKKRHKE